jgi:predicted nucleic acid-binding Zn finger protein
MLSKEQLINILSWAKAQQSKTAGDLLSRARQSLGEWDRVVAEHKPAVHFRHTWFGTVIEHHCSCPSWKPETPCKHVIALIVLQHREVLTSMSSKWAKFFMSLDASKRSRSSSRSSGSRRIRRVDELSDF